MRDLTEALADFLGPFIAEAHKAGDRGEMLMLSLACALENAAKAARAERERMPLVTEWHCRDCGKRWGVRITVGEERERFGSGGPENCPKCFNASTPKTVDVGVEVLIPRTEGGEAISGRVEEMTNALGPETLAKVSWYDLERKKMVGKWIEVSSLTIKPRHSGWTDKFFYLPEEG